MPAGPFRPAPTGKSRTSKANPAVNTSTEMANRLCVHLFFGGWGVALLLVQRSQKPQKIETPKVGNDIVRIIGFAGATEQAQAVSALQAFRKPQELLQTTPEIRDPKATGTKLEGLFLPALIRV